VPVNLEMREDWRKMKWQGWEWGLRWHSYKALSPPFFAFEGFWETVPAICAAPNSPTRFNGPQPRLSRNHSPRHSFIAAFVVTRRITADFSTIYRGSVIVTVQPLLRFFLHDLISLIFSPGTRGLAACSAGFYYFFIYDPSTI